MNCSTEATSTPYAQRLVDHLPSMLAYWDRDLRCRFANRAYETWFGADPERMVGMHIRDLLGPALFALNEPYLKAALAGEQQVFERIVPGPNGRQRHSLATYMPDIVDGRVEGIMVHVTEVTRLKETEAALHREIAEREQALASLREAQRLGQIGSWEWNAETDTSVWSAELYRMLGLEPSQPVPPTAERERLYEPDSWARLQAMVERALRTGEPYTIELQLSASGDEARWIEARGEAVRAPDGRIVGLRGTALDVTTRRKMEQARLQWRVAEAASRNKTELLSRVSHELRTPLNGVIGFADLCRQDASMEPKHREWARLIGDSGRHMLHLVDEILDLAAAETGRLQVVMAQVGLEQAIGDCIAMARAECQRLGLRLEEPPPAAMKRSLFTDAPRLRQVMDNLLSNALKYTPPGGVVNLQVQPLGDEVELRVTDSGPGLDAARLAQIFTPFNRLGAERSGVPGRGLGLAVTKALVDALQGRIRVESEPGHGSAFIVTLPGSPRQAAGPLEASVP